MPGREAGCQEEERLCMGIAHLNIEFNNFILAGDPCFRSTASHGSVGFLEAFTMATAILYGEVMHSYVNAVTVKQNEILICSLALRCNIGQSLDDPRLGQCAPHNELHSAPQLACAAACTPTHLARNQTQFRVANRSPFLRVQPGLHLCVNVDLISSTTSKHLDTYCGASASQAPAPQATLKHPAPQFRCCISSTALLGISTKASNTTALSVALCACQFLHTGWHRLCPSLCGYH